MPIKRRKSKRQTGDATSLAEWAMLFRTGFDHFGELHPHYPTDEKIEAAARAAWHRLGEQFLETSWQPDKARARPWALERYGAP